MGKAVKHVFVCTPSLLRAIRATHAKRVAAEIWG
jgi:hypothetical protein